mmetsp:Transcript_29048/g.57024  ORF Transcript_29048/g.57024 Transcript_29048/m.57024 type:complete len:395 (-) Transcript_29048:151-1335(-)|eukprot:CAMPEP_0175090012 /NCGR_PEP_ID=MMETSP0086_2-20121207/1097_1 /TAXON_ID=136419 /ORGANISM="Unknown Unknown, Strain D1" /LENGTH=394 /DNA_ID=CAMNT_0016362569 /DNA_START=94 /DNA_END=1278 /DNA_ORIENTATION=-
MNGHFLPKLYVIRGTKNKPDDSLQKAWEEYKDAQARFSEAQESYMKANNRLDGFKQTQDPIDNPELKANLLEVIAKLQQRVDLLEKSRAEQEKKSSVSFAKISGVVEQLACGGIAGAVARTSVAPIDRVKILMQTQHIQLKGEKKYTGIRQTLQTILQEEGVKRLWRGNMTNMVRVIPYSATQFATYDFFKAYLVGCTSSMGFEQNDSSAVLQRLCSGAMAGMAATTVTHPLDVIRLRLSVEKELKSAFDAGRQIMLEGGVRSFYKGYVPTLLSLSPFIAINFAAFDWLKKLYNPSEDPSVKIPVPVTLVLGGAAGMFAQSLCFPLDTVRRRMQLKGVTYPSTADAFYTIIKTEGPRGFYHGMTANAIKIIPNNAIRFLVYDTLKGIVGKRQQQ